MIAIYHYYICRIKDEYLRVGIQGDQQEGLRYVQTLVPESNFTGLGLRLASSTEVYYAGQFYYPIKSDVDEWMGSGNKVPIGYENIAIVTCKLIHQIKTKDKTQLLFLEQLTKTHELIKQEQKKIWEAKFKKETEVAL